MEPRLAKARQTYHVSIRRGKYPQQVIQARQQKIRKYISFNIDSIIQQFPSSILQLQQLVQHTDRIQTIQQMLQTHLVGLFNKVNLKDSNMLLVWSKILTEILKQNPTCQKEFLNTHLNRYSEEALELEEFDAFFKPVAQIEISYLQQQHIQLIANMVYKGLYNLFSKTHKRGDSTQSNLISFLFRTVNLFSANQISYQYIFFKLFYSETISLLKKVAFSGAINFRLRINALNIITNICSVQGLQQKYYQLLFQDQMLYHLRFKCQFGILQEKLACWRLIFNIFQQQQFQPDIIKEGFVNLATQLIIQNNQGNEVRNQICSFFINYFSNISSQKSLYQFVQNSGFLAILSILKLYYKTPQSDLIALISALRQIIQKQARKQQQNQSPLLVQLRVLYVSKYLLLIKYDTMLQVTQIVEDIMEMLGETKYM